MVTVGIADVVNVGVPLDTATLTVLLDEVVLFQLVVSVGTKETEI